MSDSHDAGGPRSLVRGWDTFWFRPSYPHTLHLVRAVAALAFAWWLLSLWGYQTALLSLDGYLDEQAFRSLARLAEREPNIPPLPEWTPLYFLGGGALFQVVYHGAIVVALAFALGIASRLTGVLTWLAAVTFTTHPLYAGYGGDLLLRVVLFYLMLGYLLLPPGPGEGWTGWAFGSRSSWLFGAAGRQALPSVAATIALRLLQVHFALILLTIGLHKLQVSVWWAGVGPWFGFFPADTTTLTDVLALRGSAMSPDARLWWVSLLAYGVLAWQIGFPAVAWRKGWQPVLIAFALAGWVGSLLFLRLPLFGPMILAGTLAFLDPDDLRTLRDRAKTRTPGGDEG